MKSAKEIRESFTSFFASKGHKIVPSAPMVIKNDPTLMFTNAGMNQFKDIILGNATVVYPRVANSQKCLRVSGKHNDLEEVGHDTYHHTMFEMLGNWSFGDYFKKDAIDWAWEYLVEVLKINPEILYVTVFEGNPAEGLERDNEAAAYWAQYLPQDRIINGSQKDNFWEMGDTGPCGPCSEIHVDLRSAEEKLKVPGVKLVNESHPQVIEIWNLVFMQFNRKADGSLELLPAKHVDTGMGFERLCMAIQGKTSNYDTDVFQPIIKAMATLAGVSYGENNEQDIALRVIADHIRTIAFSITDGQLPSNAKAGYVIRRILRRAVRYGYTFLNQRSSFMHALLPALIDSMGSAYPELEAQKGLIEKVIKEEEESFLRTLETGIRLLDKVITEAKLAGKTTISGKDAFVLYDTYGFPLDLTELIAKENNVMVDVAEFEQEMQKQRERARNAASVETGDWIVIRDGESVFDGYDFAEMDVQLLRYRKMVQKGKSLYQLVFDRTPFYGEMGGQVGDTGYILADTKKIAIVDTKKENGLTVHITLELPETIDATYTAVVDVEKRKRIAANHTATHLLHEALREVLGTHVEQKGSFVSDEALRFDFSHYQKVSAEELKTVELIVNKKIRNNASLQEYRELPVDEANKMGAMALFGEKYGEKVRVIQFGTSVELCGGSHVQSTGEIGMIKLVHESSVAAGIRRIEAYTADKAEAYITAQLDVLTEVKQLFNNPTNVVGVITKFQQDTLQLKKQLDGYVQEYVKQTKATLLTQVQQINGVDIIVFKSHDSAEICKDIAFQFKSQFANIPFAFVAATQNDDKVSVSLLLSDNLVKKGLHASTIIKSIASDIDGSGGGQPFYATAGGKRASGIDTAVKNIIESITA
ncbi:MAG: alanine--tRNA ligase [Paludibacteraceae bacterium]|nr:alanine--tRNA ligase [Paludibacteraceae bacterium]